MTHDEAKKLCGLIPSSAYTSETGYGRTADSGYADMLRAAFPGHNFRVILDRSGERTRWAITVDDNDPREHYVPVGGTCIHCGKSAAELGVEEHRDDDDEAEAMLEEAWRETEQLRKAELAGEAVSPKVMNLFLR